MIRFAIALLITTLFAAEIGAQLGVQFTYNICRSSSHNRGFGKLPDDCGEGNEYDAGLCYPYCEQGYYGVGPVCWSYCPENTTDIGAFCAHGWHLTPKKTYGRGVGKIPHCNETAYESQAGLCYTRCNETQVAIGPVCINTAGDSSHTHKCVPFIYGEKLRDCAKLLIDVEELGQDVVACLKQLIKWLYDHTQPIEETCKPALQKAKDMLKSIPSCGS